MPIAPEASSVFERHPRLTVCVLMIVSFFTLDFAITFATELVRGISSPSVTTTAQTDPNQGYRRRSDIYHHDLRANAASDIANWGGRTYRVYTDSLGFKSDRIKSTPLVNEQHRIIFIGDSFTEGIGIQYESTFVGRIAQKLRDDEIDVMNAGVSSYSPIIYWRKLKYLIEEVGLKFDEVFIYIDISDIQDEAKGWKLTEKGTVEEASSIPAMAKGEEATGLKGFIKRRFMFTFFFLNAIHDLINPASDFLVDQDRSLWTIDEKLMAAFGRDGLNKATLHMNLLHELLKSNEIKLTVAVYPWPDQIANKDLHSIQVSHWQQWASEKQVGFFNYFPCFVNAGSIRKVLESYYLPRDSHWNEEGHRLIATEFLHAYDARNQKVRKESFPQPGHCMESQTSEQSM